MGVRVASCPRRVFAEEFGTLRGVHQAVSQSVSRFNESYRIVLEAAREAMDYAIAGPLFCPVPLK